MGKGSPSRGGREGSLTICGFGLDLPQMTLETSQALKDATVVFTDALDDKTSGLVLRLCGDVRDLNDLAGSGSYDEVASRKVEEVLRVVEDGRRVAVLNYGHATFLSSLSQGLIAACRRRGIGYRILNAVSSLDAVLSFLELTALWSGLHVYDADGFSGLISVTPLQPSVPTLIVKIGYLQKEEQEGRLRLLADHLGRFYPPEHPVTLVECPWIANPEGSKRTLPLSGLAQALKSPNEFNTLYIPPAASEPTDPRAPAAAAGTDVTGPDGMDSALETGRRLCEGGDFEEAERHFSRLVAERGDWGQALAWRARCLLSLKRLEPALRDLDRCARLHPEPGWHHRLRAEVRLALGDGAGCLEDLDKAALWGHQASLAERLRRAALRMGAKGLGIWKNLGSQARRRRE
ncbi:MAG: SAM-dependent methyltransferase [Elusimicrobiota bacterium]